MSSIARFFHGSLIRIRFVRNRTASTTKSHPIRPNEIFYLICPSRTTVECCGHTKMWRAVVQEREANRRVEREARNELERFVRFHFV